MFAKLTDSVRSILIFAIMLCALIGCRAQDCEEEIAPRGGLISASTRASSWGAAPMADGLSVGLTTEDYDFDQGFIDINIPYTLRSGFLYPVGQKIELPEDLEYVELYAYAPYTTNIFKFPDNPYPPYTTIAINYDARVDQRAEGTASSDFVWGASKFTGEKNENSVVFEHKCSKLIIKLTSQTGADLSTAEVTVLNVFASRRIKVYTGEWENLSYGSGTVNVTAARVENNTYEVIIPPQKINTATPFIEIKIGKKTYTHELNGEKPLDAGMIYTFNLTVKDADALPFQAQLTYDGKPMPNAMTLVAQSTTKPLTMVEIPPAGGLITFTRLAVRNADGGYCWMRIKNSDLMTDDNVIYDNVYKANLITEENLGAERTMVLEFYNVKYPKFVHKRVEVTQAAASNYLTLSSAELKADIWGTIYDTPQMLTVSSNQNWTLANIPSWVRVDGYTPGNRNASLLVTVEQNTTGSARSGQIDFVVGGTTVKSYTISQSVAENKAFNLKYDLNLRFSTIENKFRGYHENLGTFYAAQVVIFDPNAIDSDRAAAIFTDAPYGYVTDAPTSFNEMAVDNFASPYFYYKNYTGAAATFVGMNGSILSSKTTSSQNFFRQIIFNLQIPPNVKRNEKVIFTVTVKNILDSGKHGVATVSYQIVAQ